MKKKVIIAAGLILILALGGFFLFKNKTNGVKFRTEKVT